MTDSKKTVIERLQLFFFLIWIPVNKGVPVSVDCVCHNLMNDAERIWKVGLSHQSQQTS